MPHTWGQHQGWSRKVPAMSHKVSRLTTRCWSGAFGRNSQEAAWTVPARDHAKSAATARRGPTVLKFFIEMSVKCGIDTELLAELAIGQAQRQRAQDYALAAGQTATALPNWIKFCT